MKSELIVHPQLPAPRPEASLPARIFGSRPTTVLKRITLMLLSIFVLYFGALGLWLHRIDADQGFAPPNPIEGGSHAVNMAIGLIERETVTKSWTANDPFFYPVAMQDNVQNFQRGVLRAVSRFTLMLETQMGRLRGSSAIDSDLERAVGLLQYPTDVWIFDFNQSMLPVQPAESQYLAALAALRSYNQRVALGQAPFETRADALAVTIERMADELSSRAATIDEHVTLDGSIIDMTADDIFYFNKGMSYASYLLLSELGRDFERIIVSQGLQGVWEQTIESLRQASQQRPLIVLNSSGDDSFFANHLHLQGFYLKRAILQLHEVVRVLRGNN